MDIYGTVFEVIDMRSFSNLWYWIGLAVIWSTVSHWIIGVPFDLVLRARRKGGQAEIDLEHMVRLNCRRLVYISDTAGLWITTIGFALITGLAITGFYYGVEFAQALLLYVFPLSIVAFLNFLAARKILKSDYAGQELQKKLGRHRLITQIIGMLAVFVTAMWGMYMNLAVGPFGGI